MRKKVLAEKWPTILGPLEKMLEASKSGFIVNDEVYFLIRHRWL